MNSAEIPNEYPTDSALARAMHDVRRPPEIVAARLNSPDIASGTVHGVVTLAIPALTPGATISLPWRVRWDCGESEPSLEPREAGRWRVCDATIALTSDIVAWVDVRQDLWEPHVMHCLRVACPTRSDS